MADLTITADASTFPKQSPDFTGKIVPYLEIMANEFCSSQNPAKDMGKGVNPE